MHGYMLLHRILLLERDDFYETAAGHDKGSLFDSKPAEFGSRQDSPECLDGETKTDGGGARRSHGIQP